MVDGAERQTTVPYKCIMIRKTWESANMALQKEKDVEFCESIWYVSIRPIQCVRKVAVHLGYGTYILVVSIEGAVEVCCCFTVFSC
jgi:hypothetical protein